MGVNVHQVLQGLGSKVLHEHQVQQASFSKTSGTVQGAVVTESTAGTLSQGTAGTAGTADPGTAIPDTAPRSRHDLRLAGPRPARSK